MLKLEDLRAGYDSVEILHGITHTFADGTNYCILGPNGCGKTTLVRAIAALIPSTGTLTLDEVPIASMKRGELAQHIAVMSQVNSVYFPYTVYDTVLLGRYAQIPHGLFGGVRKQDREIAEYCLQSVGLWSMKDKFIDTLSGGQRQRVFLAQALAQDPEIILLDEPTNHLDIKHQIELIDLLREWSAKEGHMVIGVLHDINLALRLTDNVLFMRDGHIERSGRFGEVTDIEFLNRLYDTDIARYMRASFERWEKLK